MYIIKGRIENITHDLGCCVIDVDQETSQLDASIIVLPEKPFLYWNKRYQKALNSGVISQYIYDTIITQQNENKQVIKVFFDVEINQDELISLIKFHNLDVNIEQDIFNIVLEMKNKNYNIIKSI